MAFWIRNRVFKLLIVLNNSTHAKKTTKVVGREMWSGCREILTAYNPQLTIFNGYL